MKMKILMVSVGFAVLLSTCVMGHRSPHTGNYVLEKEFTKMRSKAGKFDTGFYDNLRGTGPEKLPIEIFETGKNDDGEREAKEEEELEKISESEVDEETIRKAEKMADKDLLNGLNRILKNNETLKDIFRSENVHQIP